MRYTIQKILEFHDLFPEENDLDERVLLTKYNREYIVRCCHVLCNNYGNAAFIPDTKNTFFSDVSKKYISDLNNRISKYFNSSRQNRICYCTIKSALELMRVAFSIPIQEYRIEPRYNSLNKLAKELLSDFKEVDDNFKGIIKEIYERQTENAEKKALLNYIFDAYGELKQSQQGKSFYAFWEFLLSADLQKEWDELTGVLYKTLENRGIDAHDMFLKEMKKHLFDAGEKVAKTNDRMSEKLSRIIRQNGHMNAEATKQVINDIKKLLIEASRRKEKPDASLEYETIDINLPLERPLTLTPVKETVYKDKPDIAGLSLADLESIGKLYNPYHIDRKVLRDRINEVLNDRQQTTLAEVIERNEGVEKGLSEVFGYIGVLKEYKTVVSEERQQHIIFTENKTISIPEIIITR